jgi:hypothetical protein
MIVRLNGGSTGSLDLQIPLFRARRMTNAEPVQHDFPKQHNGRKLAVTRTARCPTLLVHWPRT